MPKLAYYAEATLEASFFATCLSLLTMRRRL